MSDQTTPAGWYPHPSMAGTLGYWDGTHWTEQVAPAQQTAASAPVTDVNGALLVLGYVLAVAFPIGGLVVAAVIWRQNQTHAVTMLVISLVCAFVGFQLLL